MIDEQSGRQLLLVARNTLVLNLQRSETYLPDEKYLPASLLQCASCFVTLFTIERQRAQYHQRLRGCIGSTHARLPLVQDAMRNALAAARDPRFQPLQLQELDDTRIQISVLHPMQRLQYRDYEDLLARLHPGVDGVLLTWQEHKGLLLPQVWERLPQTDHFMQALCHKAQIPRSVFSAVPPQVDVATFTTTCFSESVAGSRSVRAESKP